MRGCYPDGGCREAGLALIDAAGQVGIARREAGRIARRARIGWQRRIRIIDLSINDAVRRVGQGAAIDQRVVRIGRLQGLPDGAVAVEALCARYEMQAIAIEEAAADHLRRVETPRRITRAYLDDAHRRCGTFADGREIV